MLKSGRVLWISVQKYSYATKQAFFQYVKGSFLIMHNQNHETSGRKRVLVIHKASNMPADTGIQKDKQAKLRWKRSTDRLLSNHFNSDFWLFVVQDHLRLLPAWISLLQYITRCTRRSLDWLIRYRDFSRDMSRSSRRNKSLNQGYGGPGCDRMRMPRARSLLFCLIAVLVLTVMLGVYLSNDTVGGHVDRMPTIDLARARVRDVRSTAYYYYFPPVFYEIINRLSPPPQVGPQAQ